MTAQQLKSFDRQVALLDIHIHIHTQYSSTTTYLTSYLSTLPCLPTSVVACLFSTPPAFFLAVRKKRRTTPSLTISPTRELQHLPHSKRLQKKRERRHQYVRTVAKGSSFVYIYSAIRPPHHDVVPNIGLPPCIPHEPAHPTAAPTAPDLPVEKPRTAHCADCEAEAGVCGQV